MRLFRHNKLWLAVTLILAMVFTIGGVPAHALACGDPSAPVSVRQAVPEALAAEFCSVMGEAGHCCCGPKAQAPASQTADCELTQPGCGCSVQAPDAPPPAELKAARFVFSVDAVLLPPSPVSLQLPTRAPWSFAAPTTGPPRKAFSASSPSRAPPAC